MKNTFFLHLYFILLISNFNFHILYANSPKESYLSKLNVDILSLSNSFPQMEKKTYQVIIYNHNGTINGYIQSIFDEKNLTEDIIFYNSKKKILLKEILKYNNTHQLIEKNVYSSNENDNKKEKLVDFSNSLVLNEKISFNYSKNHLKQTSIFSKEKQYSVNYSYVLNDENENLKLSFKHYVGQDAKYLKNLPSEKVSYFYYINGIKLEIFKLDLLNNGNPKFHSGIVIRNKNEKTDFIESIVKLNEDYTPYRYIKYIYNDNKVTKILVYKVFNYNHKWENQFKMIPEKNLFLLYTFDYNYNISDNKISPTDFDDTNSHFINEIPVIRQENAILNVSDSELNNLKSPLTNSQDGPKLDDFEQVQNNLMDDKKLFLK